MASGRRLSLLALALLPLLLQAQTTYKLRRWGVPPAHYSGITPLGDGRYAVVSDDEPLSGFYVWRVDIDSLSGRVEGVTNEGFRGVTFDIDRDAEGIAFCPQRQTLFISGEADQRILEHRLDGSLTGLELEVPASCSIGQIRPNRGFEALGYDNQRRLFWTCPESPLRGEEDSIVPLLCFGSDLRLLQSIPYQLDAPQSRRSGREHYHGVVAVTPLTDGSLLVLEREALITQRYSGSRCWCRLFQFRPAEGTKMLLAHWRTKFTPTNTRFANYEGMCLGPQLADGRQSILLIADSQGGVGRGPWRLRDKLRVLELPLSAGNE